MSKSVRELFEEQVKDNKQSVYEKNKAAGGNWRQRELYLDAGKEHGEMKGGGVTVKKKNKGSYLGGGIHMKKKTKKSKYFIGGLVSSLAMGPIGMAANLLKKKKDKEGEEGEGEAQSQDGKVLTVKVIGGEGQGEGKRDQLSEEARKAKEEAKKNQDGGGGQMDAAGQMVSAKKGAYIKRYDEGGTPLVMKTNTDKKDIGPKNNPNAKPDPIKPSTPPLKTSNNKGSLQPTKDFAVSNVKSEVGTRAASKTVKHLGKRTGSKVATKVGSRFIPGVGWVALGADLGIAATKAKAKGYAEMDERSPGTSKHLETGAYGQQTSDSGHKVRGTFFSMAK